MPTQAIEHSSRPHELYRGRRSNGTRLYPAIEREASRACGATRHNEKVNAMNASVLNHLKEKNREWAARMTAADPDFFKRLKGQQAPEYLWIGCSDSRGPANQIVDLDPGELFVHRNVRGSGAWNRWRRPAWSAAETSASSRPMWDPRWWRWRGGWRADGSDRNQILMIAGTITGARFGAAAGAFLVPEVNLQRASIRDA